MRLSLLGLPPSGQFGLVERDFSTIRAARKGVKRFVLQWGVEEWATQKEVSMADFDNLQLAERGL